MASVLAGSEHLDDVADVAKLPVLDAVLLSDMGLKRGGAVARDAGNGCSVSVRYTTTVHGECRQGYRGRRAL